MNAEYYLVTVREEEVTGYNQKKGEDIIKKKTYVYLVHTADPKVATEKVEKEMQDSLNEWKIVSVKESKVTEVLE